jgi:hypothetical protein
MWKGIKRIRLLVEENKPSGKSIIKELPCTQEKFEVKRVGEFCQRDYRIKLMGGVLYNSMLAKIRGWHQRRGNAD